MQTHNNKFNVSCAELSAWYRVHVLQGNFKCKQCLHVCVADTGQVQEVIKKRELIAVTADVKSK